MPKIDLWTKRSNKLTDYFKIIVNQVKEVGEEEEKEIDSGISH